MNAKKFVAALLGFTIVFLFLTDPPNTPHPIRYGPPKAAPTTSASPVVEGAQASSESAEPSEPDQQASAAPTPEFGANPPPPSSHIQEALSGPGLQLNGGFLQCVQEFTPVSLRGYGSVSASYWKSRSDSSVLLINCETPDKARLTHAKYLSDISVTPGTKAGKLLNSGVEYATTEVENQGIIVALLSANRVFILAADTNEHMGQLLLQAIKGDRRNVISAATMEVPMWLNRWDKYGFRFYYRPWEHPKKETPASYDITKEFDFARESKAGLVFWSGLHDAPTAEGSTTDAWWDWAEAWSIHNGMPAGMNDAFSVPHWLADRYREQLTPRMPQYLGDSFSVANTRGIAGYKGELPFGNCEVLDAVLVKIQTIIRRFSQAPNVTSFLEPHGEVPEGGHLLFSDYGPSADKVYQEYLQQLYGDVAKLSKAWHSKPGVITSWDQVHVPELASFAGWGPDAIDLTGEWKLRFMEDTESASDEWIGLKCNDSRWASAEAPGNDRSLFFPKKQAIYRRSIDVPASWLAKHHEAWLYLWDLNEFQVAPPHSKDPAPTNHPVAIYINGKIVAKDLPKHAACHRVVAEITDEVKPGKNLVTLELPQGYIGYRVYISSTKPIEYPNLGPELNAQWVDFVNWRQWARTASIRRGAEMIREVDPNRQIDFMHPDDLADGVKQIDIDLGGNFKNTGYMGAFWADSNPSQMRAAGLPFSLEPGGPAADLTEFKTMMGYYQTEGIQGIDYFIHIGDIMWDQEIHDHFNRTLPLTNLIGKYHGPHADIAFLWGTHNKVLTGFPWGGDPNTNLPSGWNCKGIPDGLLWRGWLRDAVTEGDFARGFAAKYKVIIDTNTSIMDEELLRQIEAYVTAGGTFVTFVQTGRHTPTVPNSWPISQLTGYKVLSADVPEPDSTHPDTPSQLLHIAPGQKVYPDNEEWMGAPLTGLRLKKEGKATQDLLLWKDGTVAAGMRRIGKGQIIHLGCRSGGSVWLGLPLPAFEAILKWQKAAKCPGRLEGTEVGKTVLMRYHVTNNGLYDVWSIWNQSDVDTVRASLVLTGENTSKTTALDLETGKALPVTDGRLSDLAFEPLQTRVFLVPRKTITQAPAEWFALQRDWWKGTQPISKPFQQLPNRFAMPLMDGWGWKALKETDNPERLAAAHVDDSRWEQRRLGIWNVPGKEGVKHAMYRKTFTVPKEWGKGDMYLWIRSFFSTTFIDSGRVWLDGKMIRDWGSGGILGETADGKLTAGSRHSLAIEVKGEGTLNGLRGECWLSYVPAPKASINLAGEWTGSMNFLGNLNDTVTLPGKYQSRSMRRKVMIPKEHAGSNVVLDLCSNAPVDVIINGSFVTLGGPPDGTRSEFNLTPWILFGEENDVELVGQGEAGDMTKVCLDIYPRGTYP